MPIYEYRCTQCGDEFDKMVRFSEADQAQPCPACQSRDTRKKISIIAAQVSTAGGGSLSSSASCGSGGGFT